MGHPILRQRAREVDAVELASRALQILIDDMVDTMRDADGAGLAAPQVHESVRVAIMEIGDNPRYPNAPASALTVFVNPVVEPLVPAPEIASEDDVVAVYEGCLSVPGLRGLVRRPRKVRVRAWGRDGQPFECTYEGFPAAVVQHELDHLDGVLYVDRVDTTTLTFLREFERYVPVPARFLDGRK
jgi:peptide deformylase